MSCLTTSGAPVDDLIVASCAPFIFRKSHKTASRKSRFFNYAKTELVVIFTPSSPSKTLID